MDQGIQESVRDLHSHLERYAAHRPKSWAELLIDCEEDRTLRAALVGMLPRGRAELDRHLGTPKPRPFQDRSPPLPVHAFIGTVVLEEKDPFVGRPLLVDFRIEFAQRSVDCVPYAPKFAIQRTPPILEIGEDPIGLLPCLVQRTAQPSEDWARSLMAESGWRFRSVKRLASRRWWKA